MRRFVFLENASIAVAIIFLGIMAGFFWTYTVNVNAALLNVNGQTYAQVQSLLNEHVRHLSFFVLFFGAGLMACVAAAVNYRHIKGLRFYLLLVAALSYIVGVIVFTAQVNLPLNYYTESWNPLSLPEDWAATREAWNHANAIRVGTSCSAFVLCVVALCTQPSAL